MLDRSRWALLAFSTGVTVLFGCISTASSQQWGGQQPSPHRGSSDGPSGTFSMTRVESSPNGSSQDSGHSLSDYSSQRKPPSKLSSIRQSVSGTFKSVGNKMSGALAFKPRVTRADDPVRLSSMPDSLSPTLYVRAAAVAESQGNLAAAQSQYEKALELDPGNAGALVAFARFRDRLGDSDQAIQMYRQARAHTPDNAVIWNDLALCHSRRGEIEPALAALQQAVALQPLSQRYRNNLAAALVQANRPEDAVRELRSVYSEAIARHNVGYFLCRLQQYELAVEYLSHAYQLDPTLEAPQALLARLGPPQPARQTTARTVADSAMTSRFGNAVQPRYPNRRTDDIRRLPPIQSRANAELRRIPAP